MGLVLLFGVLSLSSGGGPPPGGGGGPPSGGGSGSSSFTVSSTTSCASSSWANDPQCTAWLINQSGTKGAIFVDIEVNVQDVSIAYSGSEAYVQMKATGIPDYTYNMDQATVNSLNSRPKAATDFVSGHTTAVVGTTYSFGADIGYNSNSACTSTTGKGWWPPGPDCPGNQNKVKYYPLNPQPAPSSATCSTQLGEIATLLNGVSIFDWQDAMTYNSAGVWYNVAMKLEMYDMDICPGHAAGANYHHHSNPVCFQNQLGDTGTGHSPIYGYVADGYPIYGPYNAANTKAQSCWKTRSYLASSPTGCGQDYVRSCLLVDQYDISKGTKTASSNGPLTTDTLTTLSGNTVSAASGVYFQDYYYDSSCTAQGGEYLDEHNGHSHGDYGYHYHFTDSFPYTLGPTFYGYLHDTGFVQCSTYYETGSAGIASVSIALIAVMTLLTLA